MLKSKQKVSGVSGVAMSGFLWILKENLKSVLSAKAHIGILQSENGNPKFSLVNEAILYILYCNKDALVVHYQLYLSHNHLHVFCGQYL